jgi:hypothetical protein
VKGTVQAHFDVSRIAETWKRQRNKMPGSISSEALLGSRVVNKACIPREAEIVRLSRQAIERAVVDSLKAQAIHGIRLMAEPPESRQEGLRQVFV